MDANEDSYRIPFSNLEELIFEDIEFVPRREKPLSFVPLADYNEN